MQQWSAPMGSHMAAVLCAERSVHPVRPRAHVRQVRPELLQESPCGVPHVSLPARVPLGSSAVILMSGVILQGPRPEQ